MATTASWHPSKSVSPLHTAITSNAFLLSPLATELYFPSLLVCTINSFRLTIHPQAAEKSQATLLQGVHFVLAFLPL
jgi:hypothetical protein